MRSQHPRSLRAGGGFLEVKWRGDIPACGGEITWQCENVRWVTNVEARYLFNAMFDRLVTNVA
jgi:hypothetical protein